MRELKRHKAFNGIVQFWEHASDTTRTTMKFSTFIPSGTVRGALVWLSGLTCTEENFITKSGCFRHLAANNMMVICPDTSPRGLDLPREHESYDFGSGAGFYVDATTDGYKEHYRMYSYITEEITGILNSHFKVSGNVSLSGHSMGGHGALVLGLKNPNLYRSVSAFSPIVNPIRVPWGQKAFEGYLGEDKSLWNKYDACELLSAGARHVAPLFIDQGLEDDFYENQLCTKNIEKILKNIDQKSEIKYREGYDHSYYYISTFIEEHVLFHAKYMA